MVSVIDTTRNRQPQDVGAGVQALAAFSRRSRCCDYCTLLVESLQPKGWTPTD